MAVKLILMIRQVVITAFIIDHLKLMVIFKHSTIDFDLLMLVNYFTDLICFN